MASTINPETQIYQDYLKKIDALKTGLRKTILAQVIGICKMVEDKPIWVLVNIEKKAQKEFDEIVEINQN